MNQRSTALLALLLCLCTLAPLAAQRYSGTRECATQDHSEWLDRYQAGLIRPVPKSLMTSYVPVQLNVVGETSGLGYLDPTILLSSLELLNRDFAELDIQFFIDGNIRYINSTTYYNHDYRAGDDLMREFNRRGVVNTYFVGNPAEACGYFSPGPDALALGNDCLGGVDRTWSHEMGHFLSLRHTFYGWESVGKISDVEAFDEPAPATLRYNNRTIQVERVDGSNCDVAADGFCDTAPDYLPERWRCNRDGIYPDSLLDPDSTRFVVEARNIMSYALNDCVDSFSEEQKAAMRTRLNSRVGLALRTPPVFAAADVEDLELISPTDNETLTSSNRLELVWNQVDNADFYLVQINTSTNFNGAVFTSFFTTDTTATVRDLLSPNRRYYWRVRPVNRFDTRGGFSEARRFRNGAMPTATVDAALDAALTVAPNPVGGGQFLLISGRDLPTGRLTFSLIDPTGRTVGGGESSSGGSAGFRETLPTAGLAAGVYLLRVTLNNRLVTRRVVVTP